MRAAPLLLATLVLAGCASPSSPTPSTPTSSAHALVPVVPPIWQVGDWWNFTTPGGPVSYVVSSVGATDYTLDTDNRGLAFFNALSDVSTLGDIRKSDLAGSQGATRVRFFDWPLTEGRNWTTTWDNSTVRIVAHSAGTGRFAMTATRADGTTYATYTYDNRTGFFTDLDFKDAHGQSAYHAVLQASGHHYAGTLLRWTLGTPIAGHVTNSSVVQNTQFAVPAGTTDIYISYTLTCATGAYNVAVGPLTQDASSSGYQKNGVCGDPPVATAVAAVAGSWGVSITAPLPTTATYLVVARTLHTFKPGEAPA